ATASLTITPVNDAPVLDFSGEMLLNPIAEDDTSNIGTRVTDIIASAGGDRITDIDAGALEGIAVTAVTNTNGTWQWSIDDGQIWSDFSGVSPSSARLLAADDQTRVRFVPGANYFGTATG